MGDLLNGQYPESWDTYVGQESAKRALRRSAVSANKRGVTMPHLLICAPYAGVGKTALALLTARESGRPVYLASGSMNLAQARIMFSRVEDGDVILYDEFHKVMDGGKRGAEWLLHFLENGTLLTPFGAEKVPNVSFIAATTDKGVIAAPILDRFKVIELDRYTDDEGTAIARHMAEKVLGVEHMPAISDDVAAAVAAAASNQPRRIRDLLVSVRDLVVCDEIDAPQDGSYDLAEALMSAGLTADGLTKEAQKYLLIMYVDCRAEPAGQALLRERMGLVGKGLQMVEMLLEDKELITKTKAGRVLTSAGIKRALQLTEAA